MNKWFKIDAKASTAKIELYDVIGDWIDTLFGFGNTAKDFAIALAEIPKTVKTLELRINSPGGDVFGATAMANTLRTWKADRRAKVIAYVDGIAASAATLPMMAADEIHVPDNGIVMIHNPSSALFGNAEDFRKQAEIMDQLRDGIVTTYQWHSDLDAKHLIDLMDAETWMTSEDAKSYGLATHVDEGLKAVANLAPASARIAGITIPERYSALVKIVPEPAIADAASVVAACAEAGLDLTFVSSLVERRENIKTVTELIVAEKARVAAEVTRVTNIRALSERFGMSELAPALIDGGMDADAARRLVAEMKAKLDCVEIDAGLPPDACSTPSPAIDVQAIYAGRRKAK